MDQKMKKTDTQKGVVLISSYMLLSVLSVLSFAIFTRSIVEESRARRGESQGRAFAKAEQGVDATLQKLKEDPDYPGTSGPVCEGGGCYEVSVCGSPENPCSPPLNNPDLRKITARGHSASRPPYDNPASYAYQRRQIEVVAKLPEEVSLFSYALFGTEGLKLGFQGSGAGQHLDVRSCNSDLGSCANQHETTSGHIGTNSTAPGAIHLKGQMTVGGDVRAGHGAGPEAILIDPDFPGDILITGTQGALEKPMPVMDVVIPEDAIDLGELDLDSGTLTLPGGKYKTSKVKIKKSGRVKFTGPVELYVTGGGEGAAVNIEADSFKTYKDKPENFLLFVRGEGNVRIKKSGSLYVGVYAPRSKIFLGSSQVTSNYSVYGSLFGKKVVHDYGTGEGESSYGDDFRIAYDVALKKIKRRPEEPPEIWAWRQV